jgi:hypothetical protein
MVISRDQTFPLSKEQQLRGKTRQARKKQLREQFFTPGTEDELKGKCIGYLDSIDEGEYLRLFEDWQWNWLAHNCPKQLKSELADNFAGWQDIIIFKQKPGSLNFNESLHVELKSPGKKMRKNQRDRAKRLNVRLIDNYDVFTDLVDRFYERGLYKK